MAALGSDKIVGVIGAGAMGGGIAQVAAAAGHPVVLHDARPGASGAAKSKIANGLEKLVEKGKMDGAQRDAVLGRIQASDDISAVKDSSLVIEAIVEDVDIKRNLFKELESLVSRDAILATNTSSLPIESIAAPLGRPERFGGLHFFNPAQIM